MRVQSNWIVHGGGGGGSQVGSSAGLEGVGLNSGREGLRLTDFKLFVATGHARCYRED